MPVPHSQSVPTSVRRRVGIVASIDHEKGVLILVHRGGTRSHLSADASLLRDLRIGGLVQVVLKGPMLWALRHL